MKVCVFLAVLLGCTFANNDETFLNSLQNTEFGKTIVQTIQLEMGGSSTASPDQVLELLRQMKSDIEQEQSDDDSRLLSSQGPCKEQIESCSAVITKANEKRADDERSLPLLQEEQQDKIDQSLDKEEQEQRNNDRLETIIKQRKENKEGYEERRDELSGLVATLQEAKIIISQLSGGSFLQITDPIMSEIRQHQSKFLKHYPKQRGFHSFVSMMLEALQNSGVSKTQDGMEKVITIIENLIESIYDVSKQELQADDKREQAFLHERSRILQENSRLEGTIATQRALVQTMGQKILELSNDISTQQQIADNKSTEQKDWQQTCSDSQRSFDSQSKNRNDQLEIIEQVIDIFENRFDSNVNLYIQKIRII